MCAGAPTGRQRQHIASVMYVCQRNIPLPVIRLMHQVVGDMRRQGDDEIMRPRISCGCVWFVQIKREQHGSFAKVSRTADTSREMKRMQKHVETQLGFDF